MVAIRYSIDDLLARRKLDQLVDRLDKPQEALKEIGLVLLRSVAKNFKQGGRPKKWKESKRAKGTTRGRTLIGNPALLRNSINMEVEGQTLRVGTNVAYARIHQLGGDGSDVMVRMHRRRLKPAKAIFLNKDRVTLVKAHTRKMTMPARPFLVVQDSDWRIIKRITTDYLVAK